MGKKFSSRPIHWIDVNPKFEARSYAEHAYEARAVVQRLELEGLRLIGDGPRERWTRSSRVLQGHLGSIDTDDLTAAFREFIHVFEHETERMYQMLHDSDEPFDHIFMWVDLAYKHLTYAILARFLPEKNPDRPIHKITISLSTGKAVAEDWEEGGKTTTPRRYRRNLNKIWR